MEKNEEKKIVYMECDHCKQKFSHLEMYFFKHIILKFTMSITIYVELVMKYVCTHQSMV